MGTIYCDTFGAPELKRFFYPSMVSAVRAARRFVREYNYTRVIVFGSPKYGMVFWDAEDNLTHVVWED